jgi:acyl carrier protein
MNDLQKLSIIFKNVFDDENLEINIYTKAEDIDGWDSLAHIRLILAIEKQYELRFTAAEISEIQNVGEMIDLILSKQKNA